MPVPGTNRFQPIVTDLRRTTQPMVRVLLDDLLEPLDAPCPCGSALHTVRGVEGRVGDVWRWGDVVIPPQAVTVAVAAAIGANMEWRAVASSAWVKLEAEGNTGRAAAAVTAMLDQRGVTCPVVAAPLAPMEGFKRHRVRWADA
jgi:phenylacetate-coenzyme A ligase PaaK-like adenylate-forming protein